MKTFCERLLGCQIHYLRLEHTWLVTYRLFRINLAVLKTADRQDYDTACTCMVYYKSCLTLKAVPCTDSLTHLLTP